MTATASPDPGNRPAEVTACLIIIGNEILSGRTKDANLPFLAGKLNDWGVRLREVRVVPDLEAAIVAAVNDCRGRYDYVFTSGGIGPTHDDITAACVAKAVGVPIERNAEAVALLEGHYAPGDLTAARLKMADIPVGATLVDNPVSRAPGFQLENVFVLAGVPMIFQAMLESLRHRVVGGRPMISRTVSCFLAEGQIAPGLATLQESYPELEIGSYPFFRLRRFGVSVVLRSTDEDALGRAEADLRALIATLDGEVADDPAPAG
ncbi:MAG: molybdopterin-binding protein [Alphaproteobacteria bacterium]|nr:molybdopterin-binding protein [Alphaproteobacteria bacterium]